jgi:osmoprotectant transport system substrate-binding protein
VRHARTIGSIAAIALLATACGGGTESASGGSFAEDYDLSGVSYAVGSKDFDEQLVLGHMARLALEAAGADVEDQIGLAGTAAARDALENGEIDLYWEYNGTGWGIHLGNELGPDSLPENLTDEVGASDLEQNGIRWLAAAPFNNTYALAVPEGFIAETGVATISDIPTLFESDPDRTDLCIETEFSTREDSLPGLEEFYGFEWPDDRIQILDTGVIYQQTAASDDCDFGEVFASDGRIAALGLDIIEDDRNFFPPYNPSVTIRDEKFQENTAVGELFAEISNALDLETMQRLNAAVAVDGEDPADVAREFLQEQGFIG